MRRTLCSILAIDTEKIQFTIESSTYMKMAEWMMAKKRDKQKFRASFRVFDHANCIQNPTFMFILFNFIPFIFVVVVVVVVSFTFFTSVFYVCHTHTHTNSNYNGFTVFFYGWFPCSCAFGTQCTSVCISLLVVCAMHTL